MTEEGKEAINFFYNFRASINAANMLFDEDINVKCGKETVKQITMLLNLIQKQQKELEKKDKMIDSMADQMGAICTGIPVIIKQFEKCYCEFMNTDEDCCWKTDKECSDCIKEYFKMETEKNDSSSSNEN